MANVTLLEEIKKYQKIVSTNSNDDCIVFEDGIHLVQNSGFKHKTNKIPQLSHHESFRKNDSYKEGYKDAIKQLLHVIKYSRYPIEKSKELTDVLQDMMDYYDITI
jgi:hypothetical protein